ncbi:hypothetical protein JCM8547_009411 [Rhodosporidiobolus lusitaniae]
MTVSDASYHPHAPYAFVTAPGNALDHLPEGYEVAPSTDGGEPTYAVFKGEIERSPNDDRSYRMLLLANGMEVTLISDPKTDKAAAAMDVKVGHLSDPDDIPGLAHFCEHLMFMGTEKYPAENDYTEFLTQHSGSSNAFTGMDQTCYYFDVAPAHLSAALDRFAQFFISPLFDPSCTEREANAVHSENSKNLQSDMWRMFQLEKSLSNPKHKYNRFGTGTRETLFEEPTRRGMDVRKRLIEWCEKHYSANVCKLAVVGKDSLDELTKTVIEHFSPVPNRHLTPNEFPGSPLGENELGKTVFVKSVKDHRVLDIVFPYPDESAWYASKPGSFMSHLIGHEGKGSVLSYLKAMGWANGMSAGNGANGAAGFDFFKVQVDLTKEGLDNYEQVAASIFSYIHLLLTSPLPEWSFREVSSLSKTAFRFKEKSPPSSTAMRISMLMSRPYPRELILSAPWISTEWGPERVRSMLKTFRPENSRIFVSSQQEVGGRTYGEREKWYGTEYTVEPMSEKILKSGTSLIPDLAFPEPNALIPSDLSIKPPGKTSLPAGQALPRSRAEPIRNDPVSRVWFKKDDRWWTPRAGTFFLFRSPAIDSSPLSSILSRLYTELVKDSLVEYAYDAELAGLSYNFEQSGDGILLTVDGYNDKLPVLVEVITRRMKEHVVDPKRFEIIVDQLRRLYTNFRLELPYHHAGNDGSYLIQQQAWTVESKLAAIDECTVENVQEHAKKVMSRMHIESLVHGNFTRDEALELAAKVEATLGSEALTREELESYRALVVPEGKSLARRPCDNPDESNSGIEQLTYVGDIYDDLLRIKASLFGTMVSDPLFDELRAKQQLGYIVSSGARKSIHFMGIRVIVQSDYDANHVESRINAFWESYRTKLAEMPEEQFEKYKEAVVARKTEEQKNMWEESSAMWTHIHANWYDFEQRYRDAELVKTLTKQDLVDFFERYFFGSPSHPIRRLSVHVTSRKLQPTALASLAPHIAALNVPLDPAQLQQFAATRPTVDQAKAFAEQFLRAAGKGDEEVEGIKREIEKLGGEQEVPEGYTLIGDREQWKKEREVAPPAESVEEFAHLIQSSSPAKL